MRLCYHLSYGSSSLFPAFPRRLHAGARERGVRPPRRASVRKRLALEKSARPDDGVHAESPPAAPTGSSRSLRDETLWLDRLRVAAEQNDLAEFEDLLRGYEQRFPEGQLGLEARRLRDLISVR